MQVLTNAPPGSAAGVATPGRTLVSVVLPVLNEAATLPELMRRLVAVAQSLDSRYAFEFILVDDDSSDETVTIAEQLRAVDPRISVISLRRNYGQTAALQVGFEHSRGAIVISMDSDLQHFPEDIPQFLQKIEEGFDVVCGWRAERQEGVNRRWPSAAANWLLRQLTGLAVHDIGTTFRAYRGDIVRQLRLLGEHHRFIPVLAKNVGARLTEVRIQNIDRPAGTSNYGLSRTFNVLLDIIFLVFFIRFIDRPMRVFGRLALLTLSAAALITVVLTFLTFAYDEPVVKELTGWFILGIVLGIGGIQFLLFGLVSELIVRMYFYPGQAKPYLVRQPSDQSTAPRP